MQCLGEVCLLDGDLCFLAGEGDCIFAASFCTVATFSDEPVTNWTLKITFKDAF